MLSFPGVLPILCFLLVSLIGTADGKAGAFSSSRRPEYPRVEEEPDVAHASVAHVDPSGPTWSDADAASYTSEHYWYNEVTGETSKVDPTLQLQGHHDKRHDRTYWLDPETNTSTWNKPEAYAWEELPSEDDPERRYYWNAVSGATTWDKPAILAWKTAEYGFWYNTVTGESRADPPPEIGHHDPVQNRTFWIHPETKQAVWLPPKQWSWKETVSDAPEHNGRAFFVNTLTGESTWERPAALAWSRKSRHKIFYFNRITGESTYQRPKALGYEDPKTKRTYYDVKDPSTGEVTGEVTWDPPPDAAAAWHESESPPDSPHPGKVFYHNSVTGAAQWAKPVETAWIKYHEDL